MTSEQLLPALDGKNPLGFFAALGLLRVLDDEAVRSGRSRPTLHYQIHGELVPRLRTSLTFEAIISAVLEDASAQKDNPALGLAYTTDGRRVATTDSAAIRDLKPTSSIARALLQECAHRDARSHRLVASWFSEFVQDGSGVKSKPTALHFTAGQQAFLDMVDTLRTRIVADDVREALIGPWLGQSELPSLSWDSSATRLYALRARSPTKEKRGSIPAANWLAFVAMEFFPVVERAQSLLTTGVVGDWKKSSFYWPLWSVPITASTVSSLLRMNIRSLTSSERIAMGVTHVFRSEITRNDQGGYGSFSPAEPHVA